MLVGCDFLGQACLEPFLVASMILFYVEDRRDEERRDADCYAEEACDHEPYLDTEPSNKPALRNQPFPFPSIELSVRDPHSLKGILFGDQFLFILAILPLLHLPNNIHSVNCDCWRVKHTVNASPLITKSNQALLQESVGIPCNHRILHSTYNLSVFNLERNCHVI